MAILNSDALREIESKVVRWKRNGHVPHDYPLSEVTDLCDTIAAIKYEKKRWQRLAELRKTGWRGEETEFCHNYKHNYTHWRRLPGKPRGKVKGRPFHGWYLIMWGDSLPFCSFSEATH